MSDDQPALPPIGALLNDLFTDVFARFSSYVLPGLAWYVVSSVLSVGLVLLVLGVSYPVYFSYGLWPAWGSAVGILAVGRLLVWLIEVPVDAGIGRGQLRLVREPDAVLGAGDILSDFTRDWGALYAVRAIESVLFGVGLVLFIVPGLLVKFFFGFAGTAVLVEGCGPMEAIRRSVAHTKSHFGWDLGFFFVEILLSFGSGAVPLLGPLLGNSIFWGWQMRGYRAAFPEAFTDVKAETA